MVAGHLQKKKDKWHMVVTYTNTDGKPISRWKTTGLDIKGNKKKALEMLLEFRRTFVLPGEEISEQVLDKENENITCIAITEITKNELIYQETVEEFILKFLKSIRHTVSGRTFEAKENFSRHIIEGIGKYKPRELTKSIIREFVNEFAATPYIKNNKGDKEYYGQDIINKVFGLTKTIIEEMYEEGLVNSNIIHNLKKPKSRKVIEQPKNQALNKNEIKFVLGMINEELMLKVIINMMLFLGLRPGEVLALKWSDIDKNKRTVTVNKALSVEPIYDNNGQKIGKRAIIKRIKNDSPTGHNFAIRTLNFPIWLENVIDEWYEYLYCNRPLIEAKKANDTIEYLFSSESLAHYGELAEPEYYLRKYRNFLNKKGYEYNEFNYYRFRHTFATNALKQGLDIKSVQMLLGDNDPEMVLKVYANMTKVEILEAHERFTTLYEKELIALCG